jgi:hypothetical protein
VVLLLTFSNQNIVWISHRSLACYIPLPSHPPLFDHPDNVWWIVQIMKLLIVQSSAAYHNFLPLGSKYSHHTLFSIILNLCSSLSVSDRVSHPHRTTGKIVYIFQSSKFLERRWKDPEYNSSKHFPNLICSLFLHRCNVLLFLFLFPSIWSSSHFQRIQFKIQTWR